MNAKNSTSWRARASAVALVALLVVGGLGPEEAGARKRATPREVQSFSNTTAIAINDNATSIPSTIEVSGFETPISDVNVSLNVYSHTQPADVDVLLVGPRGQTALIMSRVAAATVAANENLILDDQAAGQLPANSDLMSGTFQPTHYEFSNLPHSFAPHPLIPSPLPTGSALAVFNGTNANGAWTLFVDDADNDNPDSSGSLTLGWSLNITTANGVPTPDSDTFETQAGKTLSVPAAGVLQNDSDPDGDALTAILAGQPGKGKVEFQADGSFTYRSNKKAKGTDSFTYLAQDPTGLTALDAVTIQIKGKKQKHKKGKHKR